MRVIHLKLAARNVRRQPHRTLALGGAVAFSALIMTLISGFVNGMDLAVQDNVTLYSGGHVLISGYTASWSGKLQNRFEDDKVAQIAQSVGAGVLTVSPLAQSRATVVFGTREIQLTIRGVDWTKDKLYHDSLILSKGDWKGLEPARTMLMSAQTANRFGLAVGDQVIVRLTTASGQENVTNYNVGAIYDDAAAGGMNTAFVSFGDLAADLNLKSNEQQEVAVFLKDSTDAQAVATKLSSLMSSQGYIVSRGATPASSTSNQAQQASLTSSDALTAPIGGSGQGGRLLQGNGQAQSQSASPHLAEGTTRYRISTIQDLAGEIGSALGSIRWIGYAVFALMLIVSATGISNSYRMVLLERTKEIGMLRCIGYKKKDVFSSFIAEGIILAGGSALLGAIFALPVGLGIELIPFNPHSDFGSALVRGHLLFAPTLGQLALIFVFVTIVAIAAVYFPARRAAEVVPVEALRKIA